MRNRAIHVALILVLGVPLGGAQRSLAAEDLYADAQFSVLELGRLAEQGDARAAYLLGTRYASGRGGIRDDSQAVRWFKVAAERGLAEAQYNLAVMLASGRGTQPDAASSLRWFTLAAEQDHAKAQHALGTMYATGRGVARDEAQALGWLTRAAEQGEAPAQYNLGVFYEFGRGVGIDAAKASAWYKRAAALGYQPAAQRLAAIKARLTGASGDARRRSGAPRPSKPALRGATPAPALAGSDGPFAGVPDGHHTIQLASHRSLADAQRMLGRLGLVADAEVLRTRSKGRTWFVVVLGHYPSKAAAKSAVAALPAAIRNAKPWVRSIGGLRAQLTP